MSLALIYAELVQAIDRHGRSLIIPAQVRSVIDRHDMLVIDRSDGNASEIDFGIRKGAETIIAHFFVYPETDKTPCHVAYDVDWHGAPAAPGCAEIESRSWHWDIDLGPPEEEGPTLFSILG